MCEACEVRAAKDKAMWEAVRLGLIGISRGLGAVIRAIEKRHDIPRQEGKHS